MGRGTGSRGRGPRDDAVPRWTPRRAVEYHSQAHSRPMIMATVEKAAVCPGTHGRVQVAWALGRGNGSREDGPRDDAMPRL
jgi:hypothetical protein